MNLLETVVLYKETLQKDKKTYSLQKLGIDIFYAYLEANPLITHIEYLEQGVLDRLFLYWIPKHKKYLSEKQAYQVVATIQSIYYFLLEQKNIETSCIASTIVELYAEEYKRMYKIRSMLRRITKDPVISEEPFVIDFLCYCNKKRKKEFSERTTTYEQGVFEVIGCKEEGIVILQKTGQQKTYKLLLECPISRYLKVGDLLHAVIKKRLFYVYWEIGEIKAYYLKDALRYLS